MSLSWDYNQTFDTPHGQRTIDDLKKFTGAMRANIPSDNNPLMMAYREGQRSVMIHIFHKLRQDLSKTNKQTHAVNERNLDV